MAKPNQPTPERPGPTVSFSELTKEIARRNDVAQKAARIRRTAYASKEQMARRREWERL